MDDTQGSVTIIPASTELARKTGGGELDPALIKQSAQAMQLHRVEFAKVAAPLLDQIQSSLTGLEGTTVDAHADALDNLIGPVMDLKANGKMFGYDLVTDLAQVMLAFLEQRPRLDRDVMELMYAHVRTLRAIVERRMSGRGGASGQHLVRELIGACNRYLRQAHLPPLSFRDYSFPN
jgi:chemotaxis protein histidine kinase CheA